MVRISTLAKVMLTPKSPVGLENYGNDEYLYFTSFYDFASGGSCRSDEGEWSLRLAGRRQGLRGLHAAREGQLRMRGASPRGRTIWVLRRFLSRQRDGLFDGREDQQRGVRTREGGLGFGHERGAGREQVSGEMVGKSEGEGGRSSIFSLFTQRSLRR